MSDTLSLDQRIVGLAALGSRIRPLLASSEFDTIAQRTLLENGWFTAENVRLALSETAAHLTEEKLRAWTAPYTLEPAQPKRIGLILAGNLPLVGWADLLAVLIAGHHALVKLSSQDHMLMKALLQLLEEVSPALAARVHLVDRLEGQEAVIATGGNNSARYFEAYFGKYPHIIRKNRNSLALLNGTESEEELQGLGADVFTYFGLGCRSVSAVLVPEGYEVGRLAKAWLPFAELVNHHKYANNLDYHRAIFLMNLDKFYDMGVLLLRDEEKLYSPLAVLNLIRYSSPEQAQAWIREREQDIQVVVGDKAIWPAALPLGQAQRPTLTDYADGVDTLAWLSTL